MAIISDQKPNKEDVVVNIEKEVDNQFEHGPIVIGRGIDLKTHDFSSLNYPA